MGEGLVQGSLKCTNGGGGEGGGSGARLMEVHEWRGRGEGEGERYTIGNVLPTRNQTIPGFLNSGFTSQYNTNIVNSNIAHPWWREWCRLCTNAGAETREPWRQGRKEGRNDGRKKGSKRRKKEGKREGKKDLKGK